MSGQNSAWKYCRNKLKEERKSGKRKSFKR